MRKIYALITLLLVLGSGLSVSAYGQQCLAKWGYTKVCPTINFHDSSSASPGTINVYSWTFGDGGTSNQASPSHTYVSNGTFNVCLVIQTTDGCASFWCDNVTINCISGPTCNSNFNWSFTAGVGCPQVNFVSTAVSNPGTITGYAWNFGNGATSTQRNPTYSYPADGHYNVCLTITTNDGCTNTFCDSVLINCISCSASFTYQFGPGGCPNVAFTGTATATQGTIVSYLWDFGDGSTSTLQSPTHLYATGGTFNVCFSATTNLGCVAGGCQNVVINCIQPPSCTPSFIWVLAPAGCPAITFIDLSSVTQGTIISRLWDFGDGATSTSMTPPTHSYSANGVYNCCLTITTDANCTQTFCDSIPINCVVGPSCTAGFTFAGCPAVQFTDVSTTSPGTIVSWAWDFGDGGTSTIQNPSHTYTANGAYNVCLNVTSSDNCTDQFCTSVTIACIGGVGICNADFSNVFGPNGCPSVNFTDLSTGNPGTVNSWNWNFGDGGTATTQNPSHSYTANGTYNVCLIIGTTTGCADTVCRNVPINCIGVTCNANFSHAFSPNGCPAVTFTDLSTAAPGTITSWAWNFGDGSTSTLQSPTHTYATNGTFNACLTILTSNGCTDNQCFTVTIGCIAAPACASDFSFAFSPNGCPAVTFTDASTATPGTVSSWSWNFGDGGTSTLRNPTHTYAANGTFNTCLIIGTSAGCSDTLCRPVIINCISGPTCNAGFTFAFSPNGCPAVNFTDISTVSPGTITARSWNFGDGGTSTLQNPSHTYTANGNYTVRLIITASTGCIDTTTQTVAINCITAPTCNASYTFAFSPNGCPAVNFTDASTVNPGTITARAWNFGDGGTATTQNPSHTYTANGNYTVRLIITASTGCMDTTTQSVAINCITAPTCTTSFTANTTNSPTVAFTDASTASPGTVTSWAWNFGDGGTSTLQNPSHTYTAPGTFNVCLTTTSSDTCTDNFCDNVVIAVGIDNGAFPGAVSVYPNPVKDQLFIDLDLMGSETVSIQVHNLLGEQVYARPGEFLTSGKHQLSWEPAALSEGVYFLAIQAGDKQVVKKVIVRH